MKLTTKFIKDLKATNVRQEIAETIGTGLMVRVGIKTAKDDTTKTLYWRGRVPTGEIKRIKIARFGAMDVDDARVIAMDYSRMVRRGEDPFEASQKAKAAPKAEVMTVTNAFDLYMALMCSQHRSADAMQKTFARDIQPTLGATAITVVTEDDLGALLATLTLKFKGKGLNAYKLVNPFFKWASDASQGRSMTGLKVNPMLNVGKPCANPKPRTRKLNEKEIAALLQACYQLRTTKRFERKDKRHAPTRELVAVRRWAVAIEVLLRTGQRTSDILDMVESELDFETGVLTIPEARYKPGTAHVLPLPSQALELLKVVERPDNNERFFQRVGAKQRNLKVITKRMEELLGHSVAWSPHDLRRTFTTMMQEIWDEEAGRPLVDDVEIEATLGHTVKGVRRHYSQSLLMRSKARVLAAWNEYLDDLERPVMKLAA